MPKKNILVIVIIIVIAIVFAGFLLSNQKKTEQIDTSNWKTYRNEQYGFEFRYPPEGLIKLLSENPNSDLKTFQEKVVVNIPSKEDNLGFDLVTFSIYSKEEWNKAISDKDFAEYLSIRKVGENNNYVFVFDNANGLPPSDISYLPYISNKGFEMVRQSFKLLK